MWTSLVHPVLVTINMSLQKGASLGWNVTSRSFAWKRCKMVE
jgi:hypothetical protein